MELWPSQSSSSIAKRKTQKRSKGKHNSTEAWSNYPILDHGAKAAATTLVKVGDELEWRTVLSAQKGSLTAHEKSSKIYPCTKPVEFTNVDASLRQRADQGARFLRTYHPDVDIPFDVIRDSIEYDDKFEKQRVTFDQFSANLLAATYCFEGVRKKAIAFAFPTGPLRRDLNISPIYLRQNSVFFQPRTQSLWSFDTPIRQIVSSAPAVNLAENKSYSLAVRTYGQVSVFDIRNQMTSLTEPTRLPFTISETMCIRSQDFDTDLDGSILDMAFLGSDPADIIFVTERGAGYRCSGKGERKIVDKLFDNPSEAGCSFWRITSDQTSATGTLASEKALRKFDTRILGISTNLLDYDDGHNAITSICQTQLAHLLCVATTSQLIWIDERFPKQPLLGWKHHRAFDRTLSVQSIEFADTSLAFLGSLKSDLVSVISVGHLQDGPLQCRMSARALPHAICGGPVVGRTLIRHPGTPSGSFSLVELSEQGSLHQQELKYSVDTSTAVAEREYVDSRFRFQWSDEVHGLERRSKDLRPDYGKLAARERVVEDLSGVYEELFGEKARKMRSANEEVKAEDVYETLEKMPFFWQRSDIGEDHMHTLFDVAFGSGEQPLSEARADFLTGTVLDSARGYRARQQSRIPVDEVAKKAAWHMNIQPILNKISPQVFKETPIPAEELDPYLVSRGEEIPAADRRESEAREQLALDLALSADVFSAIPIRNPTQQQQSASGVEANEGETYEDTVLLTQAAEKLSLTGKEPPHVTFGFLRPVVEEGKKPQKNAKQGNEDRADEASPVEESEGVAKMPLSVRLLLSEWNVGDDPYKYEFVDPYDLDAAGAEAQRAKAQSRSTRHRQQQRSPSGERGIGPSRPVQSQAPPTIVAARALAIQGKQQPGVVKISQSATQRPVQTQTQTPMPHGGSQIESAPSSSQPTMIPNTQVVPGPHGRRPGTGKTKPPKKRLGGF